MANDPRSENPLLRDEQLHAIEHAGDIRQAAVAGKESEATAGPAREAEDTDEPATESRIEAFDASDCCVSLRESPLWDCSHHPSAALLRHPLV